MFKAIKKWFINQMGGLYEEIMVIKSQQIEYLEKVEDNHAEMMAAIDDLQDSLEELRADLVSKKSEKKKS